MKTIRRKLLCLFLAAVMSVFVILTVSCGSAKKDDKTDAETPSEGVSNETVPDGTTKILPNLPDVKYDGVTFTFLAHNITGANDKSQNHRDLTAESETGEAINDAVYRRNTKIEDTYGIKIAEVKKDDGTSVTTLKKAVNAGDKLFDAAFHLMRDTSGLITGGFLADIKSLEYTDFEKPWWDHDAIKTLSVNNKLFLINSAISLTANMGTSAIVFNKELLKNSGLESPYEMVKNNTWTIDNFAKMTRDISKDLNGDAKMDEFDQWGLIFQRDTVSCLTNGANNFIAQKNADDYPVLTFIGDQQIKIFDKIFDCLYDTNACLNIHKEYEARGDWDVTMDKMFQNNQSLFMWIRMRDSERMRAMPTDFGILPPPKGEESQERYQSNVNPYTSTIMCIPKSNDEFERTGVILEALAAESYYTVQPAYYDVTLTNKVARDEDSQAMLDIIFHNRAYDLGDIYIFGGLDTYIYETMTMKRDMVSFFDKKSGAADKAIEKFMIKVEELD